MMIVAIVEEMDIMIVPVAHAGEVEMMIVAVVEEMEKFLVQVHLLRRERIAIYVVVDTQLYMVNILSALRVGLQDILNMIIIVDIRRTQITILVQQ